jgi:hypothetical protein
MASTTLRFFQLFAVLDAKPRWRRVGDKRVDDAPTTRRLLAASAIDFYKNGPSFLERHLPLWLTVHAQRAIAVVMTIICRYSTNGTCGGACFIGIANSSRWKARSISIRVRKIS